MSFHRKAFFIWLAVMILFVVTASAIGTYSSNDEFKASAINQLIEAASSHAKVLRDSASTADDQTARAANKEAQRWEWLVAAARTELINLQMQGRKLSSPWRGRGFVALATRRSAAAG